MLDTILIAGRESCRKFALAVTLDAEQPHAAATDRDLPLAVVPCDGGPPPQGATGWFFQIDARTVVATRMELVEEIEEGRGWGIALTLLEAGGHASRCRLRCFRDPAWARQVDFQGQVMVDLPIDGDAVLIDLTPHEMARFELAFR
jgi:alpha-mannosidase